jgi:hypothetical protein
MLQEGQQQAEELLLRFRCKRIAALVVNANDLLVAGDDACLYGGYALRIGKNAALADLGLAQASTQRAARFVIQQPATALTLLSFGAAYNSE